MFSTDLSSNLARIGSFLLKYEQKYENDIIPSIGGRLGDQLAAMFYAPVSTDELTSIPFNLFESEPMPLDDPEIKNLYKKIRRDLSVSYFGTALESATNALDLIASYHRPQRDRVHLYFCCLSAICHLGLSNDIAASELLSGLSLGSNPVPIRVWATLLKNRLLLRLSLSNLQMVIAVTKELLEESLTPDSQAKLCAHMAAALALSGQFHKGKPFYTIAAHSDPTHPFLPLLKEIYTCIS